MRLTVIVTDEGFLTWQKDPGNLYRAPLFENDIGKWRESKVCCILTSNVSALSPAIKANIHTEIVLNVAGGTESLDVARTFGLNNDERDYLDRRLTQGEALLLFGDGYRYPVHLRIPRYNGAKQTTPTEWATLRRRIERLLPTQGSSTTIPPPPPTAPTPSTPPVTVSSSPEAGQIPSNAQTATEAQPTPPIALNANEEALLKTTCARLMPATIAYNKAGLGAQAGDRAKKKLLSLGLLEEERVVIRSGRGGAAIALVPSPLAYERLGIKRAKSTRAGDSVQHRFLCETLAASLPGALIETKIGDKSADLVVRYDPRRHRHLLESVSVLAGTTIELSPGSLLAIEVEVSHPLVSGPPNVARNHAAGIAFTILATIGQDAVKRQELRDRIPSNTSVAVVDALELLDHLRYLNPKIEDEKRP